MRVSPAPAAVQLHEAPNEPPAPAAKLASGAPSSTPPEKERVDGEQHGSATAAPRGRPKLPPIATAAAASPAGRMSAAVAAGIPPTPVKGPAVMAPPALAASASMQPQRVGSVSMRVKPSSDATASQDKARSRIMEEIMRFDRNADGVLSAEELAEFVEKLVAERSVGQIMRRMVVVMLVFSAFFAIGIVALALTVAIFVKDTQVSAGGALVDKRTGQPVYVANYESSVLDSGIMVARKGNVTRSIPVSVASATASASINSNMPMTILKEMKYLQVTSSTGAQLSLFVLAVAKMPSPYSVGRYSSCEVIRIVTYVGTITVKGDQLLFEQHVGTMFQDAGFDVDGAGRKLLGIYDLLGFFNVIADINITNFTAADGARPHIASSFVMQMKRYEPCSPRICIDEATGKDLPGTEVFNGTRYMTSMQTVQKRDNMILTTITFAVYSGMVKKELVDEGSGTKWEWQSVEGVGTPVHCSNTTYGSQLSSFASNATMKSFTFAGYEDRGGVPVRHFVLSLLQPDMTVLTADYWDTADNGDFCGNRNNYPVELAMTHPDIGHVRMVILRYQAGLLEPATAFALPAANFTDPVQCPGTSRTSVPLMHGPFDDPWALPLGRNVTDILTAGEVDPDLQEALFGASANATNTTRRQLLSHFLDSADPPPEGQDLLAEWHSRQLLSHFLESAELAEGQEFPVEWHRRQLPSLSVGPCSVSWKNDDQGRLTQLGAGCGGTVVLVYIEGEVELRITYGKKTTYYCQGCLTATVGLRSLRGVNRKAYDSLDDVMRNKTRFSLDTLNLKLGQMCAGYDSGTKVFSMTDTTKLPNLVFLGVKWELRQETNFRNCFSTKYFKLAEGQWLQASVFAGVTTILGGWEWNSKAWKIYEGSGC